MLNNREATELISKSLQGQLSSAEEAALDEHCSHDNKSRQFAQISRAIHDSVASIAQMAESDDSCMPSLCDEARKRLKDSIRGAQRDTDFAQTVAVQGDAARDIVAKQAIADGAISGGDDHMLRQSRSRLKLIRKIGDGGLGTVWLARDEWMKRLVAVKEMNSIALESPKAWARFLREAQITSHLEHPSIVPLYSFGEDAETGQPFYSMRFVGKRTLHDAILEYHEKRLAGEPSEMDLHRLLVAFQSVCQALAYVHAKGVIHRDLKPENVALNNFGQVVVLDWGLAKFIDDGELGARLGLESSWDEGDITQTMDGEIVGTPLYMSPEQAVGDLDSLDQRTDVFGLGAILFAILTGGAPHEVSCRSESGKLDKSSLLQAIAERETPSPRERNPSVSRDLDAICTRAMAKRRHSRFASAGELANEIELWLSGRREKPRHYELVRMEGREIRANLESSILDLTKNVRFMANLPPIQGLIQAQETGGGERENKLIWRERLSSIFHGLLRTNSDYAAVVYCQVADGKSTELVRVERHSSDQTNIRAVPISRLETRPVSEFVEAVMKEKPEEVYMSHEAGSACEQAPGRLFAGVPVFDESTEEPFGFVIIESDLPKVLKAQIRQRVREARQLLLLDQNNKVRLRHARALETHSCEKAVLDRLIPNLQEVLQSVACSGEYVDNRDHEVYASRIALPGGLHSLTLVMLTRDRTEAAE